MVRASSKRGGGSTEFTARTEGRRPVRGRAVRPRRPVWERPWRAVRSPRSSVRYGGCYGEPSVVLLGDGGAERGAGGGEPLVDPGVVGAGGETGTGVLERQRDGG